MKPLYTVCLLLLFSCNTDEHHKAKPVNQPETADTAITNQPKLLYRLKLNQLTITGHFKDRNQTDTLYQHIRSLKNGNVIDSIAMYDDWYTSLDSFNQYTPDVYLAMHNSTDTIFVGKARGLYCLINIGDNNGDGKEEIALVAQWSDFTSVNTCNVYSICNNKWVNIFDFTVHEQAFWETDTTIVYNEIKGFLVKKKNSWYYTDYQEQQEQTSPMKKLKTRLCK